MMLRTPTKATTRGQGRRGNVVWQAIGGQWEQMQHEYAAAVWDGAACRQAAYPSTQLDTADTADAVH